MCAEIDCGCTSEHDGRGDDGKWVEAVVARCLTDGLKPEQARDLVLGYALAQLLWFWRHPIPEPWATLSERWEYVAAMRLVYEPAKWASGNEFDEALKPHKDQVTDALKQGTWQAYAALPKEVWGWIAQISGMTCSQWRRLPDDAALVMDSFVICPVCGTDGMLKRVGKAQDEANPHFIGARLHVNCSKCHAQLAFDASQRRVRPLSAKWTKLMIAILLVLLAGLVLSPLLTLLRGMF